MLSIDGSAVGGDENDIQAKLAYLQQGHRSFEVSFGASFEPAATCPAPTLPQSPAEPHSGAYRHAAHCLCAVTLTSSPPVQQVRFAVCSRGATLAALSLGSRPSDALEQSAPKARLFCACSLSDW
jgi:hypothetical protein